LTGGARHAVLLEPSEDGESVSDAWITWATHQPLLSVPDPYVILDMPRSGGAPYARPAEAQRALWRDLDALLLEGDQQGRRPWAFEDLPMSLLDALRVRAYGFDQDGQQTDRSWFEATTPEILAWQEGVTDAGDVMARHFRDCHKAAEDVADRLEYAAKVAWKLATDPPKDPTAKLKLDHKHPGPWARQALGQFWPAAERTFWGLLTPEQAESTAVFAPFVDVALAALDSAMGSARADLRGARARSRARGTIRALARAA
jgi:CRISPR system Cascade subunit CasA